MTTQSLGELHVNFTSDHSQITRGIDSTARSFDRAAQSAKGADRATSVLAGSFGKTQQTLSGLQASVTRTATAVTTLTRSVAGLGAAFVGSQIVQFTANAIRSAAEIGRLATQVGLTAERFQELAFSMRAAGVDQQQFAQSVTQFNRSLSELQSGTGPLLEFLRQSAPEFVNQFNRVTSVSEAFSLLANVLQKLPSSQDRVRLAQMALGEAGARMVGQLSKGSAALEQSAKKAHELGAVLEDSTIKQATELEIRFRELVDIVGVKFKAAVLGVADALGLLSKTEAEPKTPFERQLRIVKEYEKKLADARAEMQQVERHLNIFGGSLTQNSNQMKKVDQATHSYRLELMKLNELAKKDIGKMEADEAAKAQEELNKRIQTVIASLKEQARLAGMTQLQRDTEDNQFRAGVDPNSAAGKQIASLTSQVKAATDSVSAATAKAQADMQTAIDIRLQQTGLLQDMILTQEDYAKSVADSEAKIRAAITNTGEANLRIRELQIEAERRYQQAAIDTAQMAGQALTTLFPKSKAAAAASAVMNTALAITNALANVPWPLNWVQAGLVAAMGAKQIASIKSASMGGGSVPSVSGGGGSAPTPPSTPQTQQRGSLQIVVKEGMIWSTDQVVDLLGRINEEVSNGNTLISTRTAGA